MFFRISLFLILMAIFLNAQTFTKVTDESNPIVSTQTGQNYSGAAWIDYNNDGLLDLFATPSHLFKNTGDGNFETITSDLGILQKGNLGTGVSWADYDNDGDIDCFISGRPSILYRNDENDQFNPVLEGELTADDSNRGWGCAWADYDNDGYTDIIITHPAGFLGPALNSHFFVNTTNGDFVKNNSYQFSNITAPYTVATWSDYDLDGDMDLFIGSGPAGTAAKDYLYDNKLIETGSADLVRINTSPIGTDFQDGQVWNWIDYDNDGDLDGYLTNYGGAPNRFYRNDNGNYTRLTNPLSGSGSMLANSWADVDNDGDLDVVLTGDTNNGFYVNNGDGTFTSVDNEIAGLLSVGASWGDYDNDGDLDLFLSDGNQANNEKALFRNDSDNDNNWLNISLTGTVSNYAAIGARVRAKATINGTPVWQLREVSAQNSFNSHNSLRVHFGLADAESLDSLQVIWPSGQISNFENISTGQFITITEQVSAGFFRANFKADKRISFGKNSIVQFYDLTVTGSENPATSWMWDFNNDGIVDVTDQNPSWTYDSSGTFSVKLTVSDGLNTEEKIMNNFFSLKRVPGFPIINSLSHSFIDTTIARAEKIDFSVLAADTSDYDLIYSWKLNSIQKSADSTYNYRASSFGVPRTDTVIVEISNGFNITANMWIINVVTEVTAIDKEENGIPKKFSLEQNYPNPFNPETVIRYQLKTKSNVKLTIHNLLGQKIITLVDKNQNAGFNEILWNGKDAYGKYVGSGFYFYSIEAISESKALFRKTRKMLLVK